MPEITRNLAIIVGIDKYSHVPKLTSAGNDARRLAEILENPKTYGYDVLKLLDEQASCQQFSNLIEDLRHGKIQLENELITLEKNHRLLFYFAGHGIADDAPENEERPEGFLVPQDAELNAENSKLISMQLLHDALVNNPCRHLLIILDCCFAGSFRWAGLHRNAVRFESTKVYLERYRRFIEKRAQQVITSAAYNQKAFDSIYRFGKRADIEGHSPFAELLFKVLITQADRSLNRSSDKYLAAIAEDGVVTATELYTYLHGKLHESLGSVAERQTPGFCQLRGHEEGEYIFPLPGFKESSLATAEKLSEKLNPYKGLNSFEVGDNELFFGRKALIDSLCKVVDTQSLTVVLGASGSGKSSLVKAGLVPCLTAQGLNSTTSGAKWQTLTPIRPGEAPLSSLNAALSQSHLLTISLPGQSGEYEQRRLADSISEWSKNYPDTKLLLVIDQFEELITLCRNDEWRDQFLDSIAEALVTQPQLRVILTLRSDFEPQLRDHRTLKERWQEARFIVRAMTREELRQAVEEPAAARVMFFESPDLVEQLIDEVANMPAALPLLSFALSELYLISLKGGRGDRAITKEDYRTLGGVTRSITQRAEQVYQGLVAQDQTYEQTTRNVMLRMISTGGGELARRRIPLSELEYPEPEKSRVDKVKESFIAARLLVPGQYTEEEQLAMDNQSHIEHPDVKEQTIEQEFIEPAHDALVRGWSRLREWRRNYEERIALQQSLTPVAIEWKKSGSSPGYLWASDPRLSVLREVIGSPQLSTDDDFLNPTKDSLLTHQDDDNWLNSLEREFVVNSIQEQENQVAKLKLEKAAVTSLRQFEAGREIEGLLSAIQSGEQLRQLVEGKSINLYPTVAPLFALQQMLYKTDDPNHFREYNRLDHIAVVYDVSFSPDKTLIATAVQQGADGSKGLLWNYSGELVGELSGHEKSVRSVSFSPFEQLIATASEDGTAKLWDYSGKCIADLHGHEKSVRSVSFSPFEQLIATASEDGTAKLWDYSGKCIADLYGHEKSVRSVSFSPFEQLIATASEDGTTKLWNYSGKLLRELQKHSEGVNSVSFCQTEKLILIACQDGIARIYNYSGELLQELPGHRGHLTDACFSPDGQLIATASKDGMIRLWNRSWQILQELKGGVEEPLCVVFSPDGQFLISGWEITARVWKRSTNLVQQLPYPPQRVARTRFSTQGELIAMSLRNGIVKLCDQSRQWEKDLPGNGYVSDIGFSKDGQKIAVVSQDGTTKLWKSTGELIQEFHVSGTPIWGADLSLDGDLIATACDDGKVRLWSQYGELIQELFESTAPLCSVKFSPNGQEVIALSWFGRVQHWRLSGQLIKAFSAHEKRCVDISFSSNGELIATASEDGVGKLWNSAGELVQELRGNQGWIVRSSFSPTEDLVATATSDRRVRVWDYSGGLVQEFNAYKEWPSSVSFSSDGKTIVTASENNPASVWRIYNLDELISLGHNWLKDYQTTHSNT